MGAEPFNPCLPAVSVAVLSRIGLVWRWLRFLGHLGHPDTFLACGSLPAGNAYVHVKRVDFHSVTLSALGLTGYEGRA